MNRPAPLEAMGAGIQGRATPSDWTRRFHGLRRAALSVGDAEIAGGWVPIGCGGRLGILAAPVWDHAH